MFWTRSDFVKLPPLLVLKEEVVEGFLVGELGGESCGEGCFTNSVTFSQVIQPTHRNGGTEGKQPHLGFLIPFPFVCAVCWVKPKQKPGD